MGTREEPLGLALKDRPHVETAKGVVQLVPCAAHALMERLGDRWTMLVLAVLDAAPGGRARFGEVRGRIRGISRRMLTVVLRDLERNGMVEREVFAEVPPRVQYALSPLGREMIGPLETFGIWVRSRWDEVERARTAFDARERKGG